MIRRPFRPLKRFYYKRKERIQFQRLLRPTDVFLVGHPKSGNTWIALMLAVIIQKNFDKNATLANIRDFIPSFHAKDREISLYTHFPNPRIFRNEGPLYPELYPKTIYLIRDPRSVYISYYQHYLHDARDNNLLKFEDFVDELLTYGCIRHLEPHLIRWDRQVSQWLKRSKSQPVKIVKYEEMKSDRRKVLEDVIDFAGIICDKKDIDIAVERGSFESMRKEEETFGAESYSGTKGERGYYVRQGKISGWKDEMSQDIAKRMEREFSEVMKKVGYL